MIESHYKYLFVYGTLMQGYWNHGQLGIKQGSGTVYVGEAVTEPGFGMATSGAIPSVFRCNWPGVVYGELYIIHQDVLEGPVDRLEGHPHRYRRDTILVECDGTKYRAEVYLRPYRSVENLTVVPSGDFRQFTRDREFRLIGRDSRMPE